MSHRLLSAFATVAALLIPQIVTAQSDFPKRQIRILVGFPAGGSTDVLARVLAHQTRKAFGQDMLVINKAGASGALALNELMTSAPDGYTIAMTPSSVVTLAHYFQSIRPDLLEKTEALLMAARQRAGMMTRADSPILTFADFVRHARVNPGKLSVGIVGPGTIGAIILRAALQHEKLDVTLVPLNGDAPVANAVLAGHVSAGVSSAAAFSEHIRAGTMRLLASAEAGRINVAPDVPNFVELGYPYKGNGIQYLLAPRGLPPAVRQKLIDALADAMKTPAYIEIAKKNELYDPTIIKGDDLDKYLLNDRAEISALIDKLGLGKK